MLKARRWLRQRAARRSSRFPESESVLFLAADVSRSADVEKIFAGCQDRFGDPDILVNNAGIQVEKTIETTTEEEWDRIMAVNVKSIFLCARAALAPMRRRGGGSIINIGSYDGFVADPGLAAYCASKGGVHALTRAIAVDHGKDGIRCNVICPGWIETEMAGGLSRQHGRPRRRAGAAHLDPSFGTDGTARRYRQPRPLAGLGGLRLHHRAAIRGRWRAHRPRAAALGAPQRTIETAPSARQISLMASPGATSRVG